MIGKTSIVLLVVYALIQFYRPDKNLQKRVTSNDFLIYEEAPKDIMRLYTNACYDCHSSYTKYEWFDNIAPISWYVDRKIKRGNFSLNFSIWKDLNTINKEIMFAAIPYNIESDAMPKKNYKILHPKAELSDEDKIKMILWLQQVKARFLEEEDLK